MRVGDGLGRALRVAEPGAEHGAVDDGGAVGRVDHVGQARHRGEQVDAVAEVEVGAAQRVPLARGRGRRSTAVPGSIHGLIAYSTAKCAGGHIR